MERYKYLIEELKVPSEDILVLVANHRQKEKWELHCNPPYSGLLWITTYYGFIRDELTVFYPYVLESCSEIKNKSIKPFFLTFECSKFLLEKAIEGRRKIKGEFSSIASSDSRIASELASVFTAASVSGTGQDEISKRLSSALEVRDTTREQLYGEVQELIADYRKKCLELGVFDTALAAEVYNRYLLKNENYIKKLHDRVKHLIADDIQICAPVEADLIEVLLGGLKTCVLGFNHETAASSGTGEGFELLREKILSECRLYELKETHTCPDFMTEFSEMLYENISENRSKRFAGDARIERHPLTELRSDMLKSAAERVIRLVRDEGVKPSDIVILSTYADRVTEFALRQVLENSGISLKSIPGRESLIDNPYARAMATLAALCCKAYGILPEPEGIRELVSIVLDIDPVRASVMAEVLADEAAGRQVSEKKMRSRLGENEINKFTAFRDWIAGHTYDSDSFSLAEFFETAFNEILVSSSMGVKDAAKARKLSEAAEAFEEAASRFDINTGKNFLKALYKRSLGEYGDYFLNYGQHDKEQVVLTTPRMFIESGMQAQVLILTSINSVNWYPRTTREIFNPHVFKRTWDGETPYTEEAEEENRRIYLSEVIRAVLKRCGGRIITFGSRLSGDGYENRGLLSEYLDEILGGIQ